MLRSVGAAARAATALRRFSARAPAAYDIAVVGGGVVGLSIARRAARAGHRVVVLEGADFLLTQASGANSGIFTDAHDTCKVACPIEHACLTEGAPLMAQMLEEAGVPTRASPLGGSLVVAFDEEEVDALPDLCAEMAMASGDLGVRVPLCTRSSCCVAFSPAPAPPRPPASSTRPRCLPQRRNWRKTLAARRSCTASWSSSRGSRRSQLRGTA